MTPATASPAWSSRGARRYKAVCFQCVGVALGAVLKDDSVPPLELRSKKVSKWTTKQRRVPLACALMLKGAVKSRCASVVSHSSNRRNADGPARRVGAGTTSTDASTIAAEAIGAIVKPYTSFQKPRRSCDEAEISISHAEGKRSPPCGRSSRVAALSTDGSIDS